VALQPNTGPVAHCDSSWDILADGLMIRRAGASLGDAKRFAPTGYGCALVPASGTLMALQCLSFSFFSFAV
jgi:hypothetical protein